MFIHRLNAVRSALGLPWTEPGGNMHKSLNEAFRVANLLVSFNLQDTATIGASDPWHTPTNYVGARLARLERHVYRDDLPASDPPARPRAIGCHCTMCLLARESTGQPPYFWLGAAAVSYPTLRPGMDF